MNVEPGEDISKPNPNPDSCNDWGPELMEGVRRKEV
jgi:hypothetical protein